MGTKNTKGQYSGSGAPGQKKGNAASSKKPKSGVAGQRLSSSGGGGSKKTAIGYLLAAALMLFGSMAEAAFTVQNISGTSSNYTTVTGSLTLNGTTLVSDTATLGRAVREGSCFIAVTGCTDTRQISVTVTPTSFPSATTGFTAPTTLVANSTPIISVATTDLVCGTTGPAVTTVAQLIVGWTENQSSGAIKGTPPGIYTFTVDSTAAETGVVRFYCTLFND